MHTGVLLVGAAVSMAMALKVVSMLLLIAQV
jgi:hypothetical protein